MRIRRRRRDLGTDLLKGAVAGVVATWVMGKVRATCTSTRARQLAKPLPHRAAWAAAVSLLSLSHRTGAHPECDRFFDRNFLTRHGDGLSLYPASPR